MGGESKQSTTQSSTTEPWLAAQPALQGILSQLNGQIGNSGLNSAQTGAINQLSANAGTASQFAPQITNFAKTLFDGGGATDQSAAINQNYKDYANKVGYYADPNYSSLNNPAVRSALDTIATDTTNNVNGTFAAAGRDLSGMNLQTLARGIAQGQAPVILNQANADTAVSRGAQDALYGAGNTNAGLLAGLQQQKLINQQSGITAAQSATDATNASANQTLAAESLRTGIPAQQLGLLAQIGIPIAALGSQSNGQSDTTKQDSGATQFLQIATGLGSLFKSDRRLKEDIEQVGTLFDGTPVYRFRYIGQPGMLIGLMAQDIEKTTPEAVAEINGFKAVDYKLATDKALEAA